MAMIGADLGALLSLGTKFEATGEMFAGRTGDIVKRVDQALETFTKEMSNLKREADSLGSEIRESMTSLKQRADAVVWTGNHREQHNQVIAEFDSEIGYVKTAIEMFSTEAQEVVNGELTTAMTELGTGVTGYGTEARTVSTSFSSSVKSQHNAIDSVMNG